MTNAIEEALKAKTPYRAEFGAIFHEDQGGFLFTVSDAKMAEEVAKALNISTALRRASPGAFAALSAPTSGIDWKRVEEVRERHAYIEAICPNLSDRAHADRAFLLSLLPKQEANDGQ